MPPRTLLSSMALGKPCLWWGLAFFSYNVGDLTGPTYGIGVSPKRENAIQRILACTHSMLSLIPMTTLGSRHREVKVLAPGDTAIQSRASVPAQAIWLQILLVPTPFRGAFPAQALWELDQYCLPSPFLSRTPGRGCPGGRLRPARLQEREGAEMLWEAASRLGFSGAKAMPPRGSSRCPGLSEADLPGSLSEFSAPQLRGMFLPAHQDIEAWHPTMSQQRGGGRAVFQGLDPPKPHHQPRHPLLGPQQPLKT